MGGEPVHVFSWRRFLEDLLVGAQEEEEEEETEKEQGRDDSPVQRHYQPTKDANYSK